MVSAAKRALGALVFCWLALAGPPAFAAAAASAAAPADSAAAPAGGLAALVAGAPSYQQAAAALPPGLPYLLTWTRDPSVSARAQVRKVNYGGALVSELSFRDMSKFKQDVTWSWDDYRRQDKTVEKRNGKIDYNTDLSKSYSARVMLSDSWTEDRSVNSAGVTNLNKQDLKQASLNLTREAIHVGDVENTLTLTGKLVDQQGEQQNQRIDYSEAELNGAWRGAYRPSSWMSVHTGVWGTTQSGDRTLGEDSSSSSADGDSLRAGVYYERRRLTGGFSVVNSSFSKRYLDYRRNSNGIIDTIGVQQKIVQELEKNDAVSFTLDNAYDLGRLDLTSKLSRDLSENSYRSSGIGRKERHQDNANLGAKFRVGRLDSLVATYGYLWKWDDQTYKGASLARGRQISKRRDVTFSWIHDLFRDTDLSATYKTALTQEIAENEFNTNDRDRLEESFSVDMKTVWSRGDQVALSFVYRSVEDISIRRERSSNNSIKETYEVVPSYKWALADWLTLGQDFRLWIQYTDYTFSDLDYVSKDDTYNKRGNLTSTVKINPNDRLELTIIHDWQNKSNATSTGTDATGSTFYFTEKEQRISKIDFTMSYKASDWLSLYGTTYQNKDVTDSFGNTVTTRDQRSGRVGVGGTITKSWGQSKTLKAIVRKYAAYGPSVQETSKDYWDADIKFSWRF